VPGKGEIKLNGVICASLDLRKDQIHTPLIVNTDAEIVSWAVDKSTLCTLSADFDSRESNIRYFGKVLMVKNFTGGCAVIRSGNIHAGQKDHNDQKQTDFSHKNPPVQTPLAKIFFFHKYYTFFVFFRQVYFRK
jgi:hypothetical protein